jgi:nitroimidazol reductase NimA-like FMN-containing flavoprotein (pyridoxamine 5'-phosphate oxidase superfamily)
MATVRRHADRAVYDRSTIHRILDEALYCTVGFTIDGMPFVIPTIHARVGDTLYLHGSRANRMLRALAAGADACVSATIVDQLVLGRSVFSHSLNYRSAVIFGRARPVEEPAAKRAAFEALAEHVMPGRAREVRPPSERELAATALLALPISEASAKVRTGPPKDTDEDLDRRVWAGVVPLHLVPGEPAADARVVDDDVPVPAYVTSYRRVG